MNRFISIDLLNPWDPATWSSNPQGLYSELRKRDRLIDSLWLGPCNGITMMAYCATYLRWPLAPKRERLEYMRRLVRPRLLGLVARKRLNERLPSIPRGTRLLTCSGSFVHLGNCGLPVWHYSDACLGVAMREDPAWAGASPQFKKVLLASETKCYARLDRLLLFSSWAAGSAIEDHGMSPDKISVVGHAACLPDPGTHEKLGADGPPTVLFVCTDWERKGGPVVLEAFRQVRSSLPNARLVVVGYLDSSKVAGVDGVEFVGKLRKDKPDELSRFVEWYRRADVLALASTYDPMPNITLEANLCGTPVVTTRVCGVAEQMREGVNGLLSNRSPAELANRLKQVLLNNGALRYSSRQFVHSSFTWAKVADAIDGIK